MVEKGSRWSYSEVEGEDKVVHHLVVEVDEAVVGDNKVEGGRNGEAGRQGWPMCFFVFL